MQFRPLLNVIGAVITAATLFDGKHAVGSERRVSQLRQDANIEDGKNPSESRQMQVNTGSISDFFNFTISLIPNEVHDLTLCTLADQNLLINEVDLLLLDFGKQAANELSSGLLATSVCKQPLFNDSIPLETGNRRAAARRAWLWTGSGACRNCNGDSSDSPPPFIENHLNDTLSPSTLFQNHVPSVRKSPPPSQSPTTNFIQASRKPTRSPTTRKYSLMPQPTSAPTTTRAPTTSKPTTAPTTATPTTLKPASVPTTLAPKTRAPTTSKPTTAPTTATPTTLKPTSVPTTPAPKTRAPTASKTTLSPATVKRTLTTNIAPTPRIPLSMHRHLSNSKTRDLQMDPFLIPIQIQLLNLVLNQVVPNYYQCLGDSPDVNVEATRIGIAEVANVCQDTMLPLLGVSNLEKSKFFVFQKTLCRSCISLDFSGTNAAMPILGGTYINSQWKGSYGVTVTASTAQGGYTPRGQARIYDTRLPVNSTQGNIDLGSPNVNCGGIGVGFDGQPGQPGENCVPVNNVLIIQETDTPFSKANSRGGNITFEFDTPVLVSDIGLIDVDEVDQRMVIMYEGGNTEIFTYRGLGDNAVQRVIVNKYSVEKLVVVFTGTAGVTVLNFCPFC